MQHLFNSGLFEQLEPSHPQPLSSSGRLSLQLSGPPSNLQPSLNPLSFQTSYLPPQASHSSAADAQGTFECAWIPVLVVLLLQIPNCPTLQAARPEAVIKLTYPPSYVHIIFFDYIILDFYRSTQYL